MITMKLFHSGNPAWVSCQKATGVAQKMQEIFIDALELHIHRADSPEALPYNLRSSTNVFINEELVPLEVALDATAMEKYITALLWWHRHPHSLLKPLFTPHLLSNSSIAGGSSCFEHNYSVRKDGCFFVLRESTLLLFMLTGNLPWKNESNYPI